MIIALMFFFNSHIPWSIICANFLLKLVKPNTIYKDAFRELGILEVMISCLHKFAALLKEKYVNIKGRRIFIKQTNKTK